MAQKAMKKESVVMDQLLGSASFAVLEFKPGMLVEGTVALVSKGAILVDFGGIATGLVTGRELHDSLNTLKGLKEGDPISAYVIEDENEDGLVLLSLRKASQERRWVQFIEAYETGKVIKVVASEANKGGLLLELDGIKGFIPVSQLAPLHYPRVDGADPGLILQRLQSLVGIEFAVKIISIDKENGKLILSEKAAFDEERKKSLVDLKPGSVVKGKISGLVKFGIFVAFDGLEGLVHISEIAWGHVSNPADYGRLGDPVEVMVIGVEGDKISLSMKRLTTDPWLEVAAKYKVGSVVEGEINRITPFGAFLALEGEINGLIHVTEITDKQISEPGEVLKVGERVKARVIAIEPDERRIGLSIKAVDNPPEGMTESEEGEVKKPRKKATKKSEEAAA
ncbi:MAG: S1 RNA-binding domain-containing protein [Candidatus Gracilibacteria bacterium]